MILRSKGVSCNGGRIHIKVEISPKESDTYLITDDINKTCKGVSSR